MDVCARRSATICWRSSVRTSAAGPVFGVGPSAGALVAVVEAIYALAGIFTPPSLVATMPGWNLTPDGQWLAKLMGVALGSQALVAWSLRAAPPLPVAWALVPGRSTERVIPDGTTALC